MQHNRPDYNRIQDPAGLIPKDEPVFLLRGKDKHAALTVRHWADLNEGAGAEPDIIASARAQADLMEHWTEKHVADLASEKQVAGLAQARCVMLSKDDQLQLKLLRSEAQIRVQNLQPKTPTHNVAGREEGVLRSDQLRDAERLYHFLTYCCRSAGIES